MTAAARGQLDTLNMDFNKLNKEIGALRKVWLCQGRQPRTAAGWLRRGPAVAFVVAVCWGVLC